MKHFMNLKQECFQKKLVCFDKKKHKINPWLTDGILKSINSKDKLYKTSKIMRHESCLMLFLLVAFI